MASPSVARRTPRSASSSIPSAGRRSTNRSGRGAQEFEVSVFRGQRRTNEFFEDRFWAWCWYTHGKIQRDELWEARSAVEYLQSNVLVPLAAAGLGLPEEGNRRLETKLPPRVLNLLARTIPDEHSQRAYTAALLATIQAYLELFESLPPNVRGEIRLVDRLFFHGAIDSARPIS